VEGQLCPTLPGNSVTLNDKIGNFNVWHLFSIPI
jgi:hypothetical protein